MTPFVVARAVFITVMAGILVLDYFIAIPWIFYAVTVLVFLVFLILGSSVMKYNIFLKAYTSPDNADNKIAITFDDGPHLFTESILDVLREYEAKASFFLIGKSIEENPEIVHRIVDEGHAVGNHSYTHHKLFPLFSKKNIALEIEKTNELIKNITGKTINYFRPPYGVTNPAIAAAVKATQMKLIGWDLRSFDTMSTNPERVVKKVIAQLKPGSVVLLHDNREQAPQILEAILLYAKEKKYKCVTIDEIFKFD